MHSDMLSQDHLPALIARRDIFEAVMSQYLAGSHQGCATEEDKSAAHRLFGILLDGLEGRAKAPLLDQPAIRRHASRFGDALSPILRDVLGAEVPEAFIARCVDRFWATLQAATS